MAHSKNSWWLGLARTFVHAEDKQWRGSESCYVSIWLTKHYLYEAVFT
jgi:hypothetical protein